MIEILEVPPRGIPHGLKHNHTFGAQEVWKAMYLRLLKAVMVQEPP